MTENVYKKIAAVSAKIAQHGIAKSNVNKQQGFKFRGIDDVYNALAVAMSSIGLVMLPRVVSSEVTEKPTKNGGVLKVVALKMEFDFVSADDGSKHTVSVVGEAMDSGDKATNKAMSACYKYAAIQSFCIPTEGDNDADASSPEPVAQPQQKQIKFISGEQVKRLKTMVSGFAGENGLSSSEAADLQEHFKQAINAHYAKKGIAYSIVSTTQIPASHYDSITGEYFSALTQAALDMFIASQQITQEPDGLTEHAEDARG